MEQDTDAGEIRVTGSPDIATPLLDGTPTAAGVLSDFSVRPPWLRQLRFSSLVCCAVLVLPVAAQSRALAQGTEGASPALALEQSLTQLIEQSEPSVVSIARVRPVPGALAIDRPGLHSAPEQSRDVLPNEFAAGVIIAPPESDERYVLTTYHSVRGGPTRGVPGSGDGSRLEVRLTSRHACAASIVAADPRSDLAVLQLELKNSNLRLADLRPMSWANSPSVRKGQLVVTLGNPYWIAQDGSPSAGWAMVSNLARRPVAITPQLGGPTTLDGLGGLIHLDARLPIGSSGSPVVNLMGQLVGIATSLAAIEGYERSGGFALPIDPSTRWIVDSLLSGYEVEYGFLGITPKTVSAEMVALGSQPTAALAQDVLPHTPAAAAGIRKDDIILAVDGEPVFTELDLMREVTLHPPETVVRLSVQRGVRGVPLTLSVKLGKWPTADDEGIIATRRRYPLWRGLGVDYPTGRSKFLGRPPEIRPGVLLVDVEPGSPAKAAQLEPGVYVSHVNRSPVRTPAEFAEAVRNLEGDVSLRIIDADDASRTVVVRE